ncbi:hypothetical protein MMC28_008829 [Mycoblastus sanguinarius]|nr:hypothetical protein [Mycoblastus sanguinarius]
MAFNIAWVSWSVQNKQELSSQNVQELANKQALQRLSSVSVCGVANAYEDFNLIEDWTGIPSIRSIVGKWVRSSHLSQPLREDPWNETGIVKLEFLDSAIDATCFNQLYCRIKNLREFRYTYKQCDADRSVAEPVGKWEPREIVQALATHAKHSLNNLELTGNGEIGPDNLYAGNLFVGSLRDFQVLKKLRVESRFFVETDLENFIEKERKDWSDSTDESEEDEVRSARLRKRAGDDKFFTRTLVRHKKLLARLQREGKNKGFRVYSLVDMLPASLEELILCQKGPPGLINQLFRDLPAKKHRVPRLSKTVLDSCGPLDKAMNTACGDAGLEIQHLEPLSTPTSS